MRHLSVSRPVFVSRHLPRIHLFYDLGFEVDERIVFNGITDLERVAAHLTVFDVGVPVDREVQDHRNVCAAKGTGEGVFHDQSTLPQVAVA